MTRPGIGLTFFGVIGLTWVAAGAIGYVIGNEPEKESRQVEERCVTGYPRLIDSTGTARQSFFVYDRGNRSANPAYLVTFNGAPRDSSLNMLEAELLDAQRRNADVKACGNASGASMDATLVEVPNNYKVERFER